jgi:Leucine-rich repeat (LRR) protein
MRACEAAQRLRKSRSKVDLGEKLHEQHLQQGVGRRRRRQRPSKALSQSAPTLRKLPGLGFELSKQMDLIALEGGYTYQRSVPSPFSDTAEAKAFYDSKSSAIPVVSLSSTLKQKVVLKACHRHAPRKKPGVLETADEPAHCIADTQTLAKLCITEFKAALQGLESEAMAVSSAAVTALHTPLCRNSNRAMRSLGADVWAIIFLFCGALPAIRSTAAGTGFPSREYIHEIRLPIRKHGRPIVLASRLVQRLPNIRVVKLSSLQLEDCLATELSRSLPLAFLRGLQELDGSYNNMSSKGAAALIGQMSSLTTLDLSYNALGHCSDEEEEDGGAANNTDGSWQLAALRVQLAGLQQLQVLRLVGNAINDAGLRRLAQTLMALPLVELDLTYNDITSASALIEVLPHYEQLSTLKLGENQLEDGALVELLTGLEQVQSGQSGQSSQSGQSGGALPLTYVDLSENHFSDEGLDMMLAMLAAAIKARPHRWSALQSLQSLDIRGGDRCTPAHQETTQCQIDLLLGKPGAMY